MSPAHLRGRGARPPQGYASERLASESRAFAGVGTHGVARHPVSRGLILNQVADRG